MFNEINGHIFISPYSCLHVFFRVSFRIPKTEYHNAESNAELFLQYRKCLL